VTPAELRRWVGFCPRCRRVVLAAWSEGWRLAVGSERGNALGLVRAVRLGPIDPLPRDRPDIYRHLGRSFTAFGLCRGDRTHDCAAPAVADPSAAPEKGHLRWAFDY